MSPLLWFLLGAAVGGVVILAVALYLAAYVGERMFRR